MSDIPLEMFVKKDGGKIWLVLDYGCNGWRIENNDGGKLCIKKCKGYETIEDVEVNLSKIESIIKENIDAFRSYVNLHVLGDEDED